MIDGWRLGAPAANRLGLNNDLPFRGLASFVPWHPKLITPLRALA